MKKYSNFDEQKLISQEDIYLQAVLNRAFVYLVRTKANFRL